MTLERNILLSNEKGVWWPAKDCLVVYMLKEV